MASYKVICKKTPNSQCAMNGDIAVYDGNGNFVDGIQYLRFVASIGEIPQLEIVTLINDFELEISEENIYLGRKNPPVEKSNFQKKLEAQGGFMSQEDLLKELKIKQ